MVIQKLKPLEGPLSQHQCLVFTEAEKRSILRVNTLFSALYPQSNISPFYSQHFDENISYSLTSRQKINSQMKIDYLLSITASFRGFPGGSVVKNPPTNEGDVGSISGLGRSPGEGNDHLL